MKLALTGKPATKKTKSWIDTARNSVRVELSSYGHHNGQSWQTPSENRIRKESCVVRNLHGRSARNGHHRRLQSLFKNRLLDILPELPPEIEGQDCEPGERSDGRPVQKESCEYNQIKFNLGELPFEFKWQRSI